MITYREQALPLEQRTGFVLDTCSRSRAFVGAVRICKVTGTRQPELQGRGFVVPGKSPLQMEGGLLGSGVEMPHQCFDFLQKCCVLWKKMLFVFPSFRSEAIYGNRATFPFSFWIFLEKEDVVFSERQDNLAAFYFPLQ